MTTTTLTLVPDAVLNGAQCTAMSKSSNQRCGKPAIPGGTVCRFHGGAAPQVKAAAVARMVEARDLALDRLIERIGPDSEEEAPVLLSIVDKLSSKIQLLSGEATERSESRHLQLEESRARIEVTIDGLADKAASRMAIVEAAQARLDGDQDA
jgi:hypothetical protein